MQEQNESTNLFLKNFLLWNLMLQLAIIHSFFCTKFMGSAQPMTHKEKKKKKKKLLSLEFLRPCAIHKNFYWQKAALCVIVYLG